MNRSIAGQGTKFYRPDSRYIQTKNVCSNTYHTACNYFIILVPSSLRKAEPFGPNFASQYSSKTSKVRVNCEKTNTRDLATMHRARSRSRSANWLSRRKEREKKEERK